MKKLNANSFRIGLKIIINKIPYSIIENEFIKPGKGQSFNRVKMRNLISHKIIVRNRTKEIGCKGCLRLTIGMKKENLRLIEALNIYNPQIILK